MGNMKRGRPRYLTSPRQVPITFESQDLEEYKQLLPRDVSLSEGIRELIKVEIDERKKVEGLSAGIPIIQQVGRQSTISEYDIKLFQQPEQRLHYLNNLNKQQQTKIAEDILYLQQQLRHARK